MKYNINQNLILKDEDIELRFLAFQNISFDYIASLANNYEISKYVGHEFPFPYTTLDAKNFIDYSEQAFDNQ